MPWSIVRHYEGRQGVIIHNGMEEQEARFHLATCVLDGPVRGTWHDTVCLDELAVATRDTGWLPPTPQSVGFGLFLHDFKALRDDPDGQHLLKLCRDFTDFPGIRRTKRARLIEKISGRTLTTCEECGMWAYASASEYDVTLCYACRTIGQACDDCAHIQKAYRLTQIGVAPGTPTRVCQRCLTNHYRYCRRCGRYYPNARPRHRHLLGCQCKAPMATFRFPRPDGSARFGYTMESDRRTTVAMPSGVISDEGIRMIKGVMGQDPDRKVRNCAWMVDELAPIWVVSKGKPSEGGAGPYPRRLAKMVWTLTHPEGTCPDVARAGHGPYCPGVKLSPAILGKIGQTARAHTLEEQSLRIMVSRDFEDRNRWVYKNSCWWSEFNRGMCMFKAIGGIGIRAYKTQSGVIPFCRAWIIPMKIDDRGEFRPEQDPMEANAFVVFNGYINPHSSRSSDHPRGYTLQMARTVSHLVSQPYGPVDIHGSPMYVNDGSGYLIASQDVIDNHDEITFQEVRHS